MSALFLDIETQRTDDPVVIRRLQDAVRPPANYSKPDTIAKWHAEQGAAARLEAVNKTALDGTYGRLATIGFAIGEGSVDILGNQGVEESALLHRFKTRMDANRQDFNHTVAFNGEFDLRFLQQRYIINDISMPLFLRGILQRKDGYFDPMREWAGYRGYISQAELERVLGIERHDEIDGSQVGEAIDAGDWERVIAHNREDILNLRKIYKRLTQ